jgi:hypothetical protein
VTTAKKKARATARAFFHPESTMRDQAVSERPVSSVFEMCIGRAGVAATLRSGSTRSRNA